MSSNRLFSGMSEAEREELEQDEKIKKVMREHYRSNDLIVIEMINGVRTYKMGEHSVRIFPYFWNDGCELMSGIRYTQIAFSDFHTDHEIYEKLQKMANCWLMNPALNDYLILNPLIIADVLRRDCVFEEMVASRPDLRDKEGLNEIINNNSGSYKFNGNLTSQLFDAYWSSVCFIGSHICHVAYKYLSAVHKDLYFHSGVDVEFKDCSNEHNFLDRDFRVKIADALERACNELTNDFKDTNKFLEKLISYYEVNQEHESLQIKPK